MRTRFSRRVSLSLAVLWLALLEEPARATPSHAFSLGPESQASGKTGISGIGDFGAVVLNPALLGGRERRRLWLSYEAARYEVDVSGLEAPVPQEAFAGMGFALELPLAQRVLPGRPALGLSVLSPRGRLVLADLPLPETPQLPLLSDHAQSLDLALGLGAELGEVFSVGIGLRALAGLSGNVNVVSVDDAPETRVDDQLSLSAGPVFGARARLGPDDVLGAVFRGPLKASFDVVVDVREYGALVLPPLHMEGVAHYDPAEIGLEWEHRFGATRVRGGVIYARWSALHGWLGRSVRCPADAPVCGTPPAERVELDDTWSPRLGLTHSFRLAGARVELRGGYAYEKSPLPEQTGDANRWDNSKSVLSVGYGIDLGSEDGEETGPLGLDLAYQASVLHPRTHEKSDPMPTDGVPSSVRVSGAVHLVSVAMRVAF